MIDTLLGLMLIAAVFQPTAIRAYGALMAAVSLVCLDLAYAETDGILYYGSSAVCDLVVVLALSCTRRVSLMLLRIQCIMLCAIVVNLAGFVMWWAYLPPGLYNAAFVVLYSWLLFTLVRGGKASDVGSTAPFRWRSGNRGNAHPCGVLDFENGGAV